MFVCPATGDAWDWGAVWDFGNGRKMLGLQRVLNF